MVHIKKVEIFGFKSFGFKNTVIDFEPGLISISGPNGSGKSNILDAIIFALGENRPKVMRADKLKSLIHDVEGDRRGVKKMARTSVHFDNSDRKIPVDSDSVEITREMDASGENTYYLNKKKTQRSQILDLMNMANAGLTKLNNVQQGTITRISEFSPEEKRESIEQLVGLKDFDEKKAEAEKQLQTADQRLAIAMAKMGEVRKNIDNLEEERNLKLRYDFIEREIVRLNAINAANKMKSLVADKTSKERTLNALESESKKFGEELGVVKKQIDEIESEKAKFMEDANAYNQAKAKLDTELSETMEKFERAKSVIATQNRRLKQIDVRIPETKEEIKKILQEKSPESQPLELEELLERINHEKGKVNEQLESLDTELKQVLTQQSKFVSHKIEINTKIKNLVGLLHQAKLTLAKFEAQQKDLERKINLNDTKAREISRDSESLTHLKPRLESVKTNHNATITELKARIANLDRKRAKFENDIDELNLILEKSSKAANQYEAKIRIVKSTLHEDYSIAKLKENADQLGMLGLVHEMISWDKQYERAVLAASSDWIKAIVVKDFTTLVSLAEFARYKKLPKLKIIPLDAIPNFKLDKPREKGVIGILADFIKCDSKFTPIKKFLFGNIVLTNSKESAHNASKAGYKSVSINGEYFDAKSSAVVIDINSKISKLTKIISQSTSVEGLIQSNNLLKKIVQQKKKSLRNMNEIASKYNKRISISQTGLSTTDQYYIELQSKISRAKNLTNTLSARIDEDQTKNERLETETAKQNSYIDSLEQRIAIVKDNYEVGEEIRLSNQLARLNERKIDLQKRLNEVDSGFTDVRRLHEENVTLLDEQQEIIDGVKELEKEKELADKNLIAMREKEQELISTSGTSVSKINEFDTQLKELNEKDRSLTKETNGIDRQSDVIKRDLKELYQQQAETQKIIDTFSSVGSLETFDVNELLRGLYNEQRHLTELNAKAPAIYPEIAEGYRSMSTRRNSLQEERNFIVKFMDSIEKQKRQTFLDAFDKVDKEIRIIFTKMTGGNAWLELQNEDDIFNSGISYLIQFKNKPKRESTSISGGEKTLAAVVFVLALQKLEPSPFYLFDEVDAHLDAPNSEKLGKILEERSKESQFLMVSLKDSVVKRAKLIYGVFPKNGVSHVVVYKDKRLPGITT